MGDGTNANPYNRGDVLGLIKANAGRAIGLDLSGKFFEHKIDLSDLDLSGTIFDDANLFRAIFNGSNLDRSTMRGAFLDYATFNRTEAKTTSLQGVNFTGAHLNYTEFREADLSAALFQGQSPILLPAYLQNTDFRGAKLFLANFTGCYFYGTKLEGAFIRGADIFDAHLEEINWGNYKIGEELSGYFYDAERYYRRLKVWYDQAGYDGTAAKFYYREKEAQRKSLRFYYVDTPYNFEQKKVTKHLKLLPENWSHRIALQLSYWVFGHGEGWKRILAWMATIIGIFAFIDFTLGTLKPNTFLDSLYYSAVSFTAVGYGGWVEKSWGLVKWLGVTETFLGFFMMTLLLVTFVRKWTR